MKTTENKQNILTLHNLSELHASKGLFEIEDNRISQQKVAQLKTEICYNSGPLKNTMFTVGKHMHASLDPNDPVHGSEPGEQIGIIKMLKAEGYRAMVRGHLLNAELGGLGIAANLYPITSQANSLHTRYVENHVKRNIVHPDINGIETNNRLVYDVNVSEHEHRGATFHCQLYTEKGDVILKTDIESKPEENTKGSGTAISSMDPLSIKNSELGPKWGHIGRGKTLDIHKETDKRTTFLEDTITPMEDEPTGDEKVKDKESIDFRERQYLYELWESSDMTVSEFMSSLECYSGDLQEFLSINFGGEGVDPNAYVVEYANYENIEDFFFNYEPHFLLEFLTFFGINEATSFFH